jgi:hypothetical protein
VETGVSEELAYELRGTVDNPSGWLLKPGAEATKPVTFTTRAIPLRPPASAAGFGVMGHLAQGLFVLGGVVDQRIAVV